MLLLYQCGWRWRELKRFKSLAPLGLFFTVVTLSLLPDFYQAGDYRYFLFGCAHTVMVFDVFSAAPQRRWLAPLLGLLPMILALRGVLENPAILNFSLTQRLGYPLDHANTAGYLFAMSLPLCIVIAAAKTGWWRRLAWASCAIQIAGLVLTYSRGAWLGSFASIVYLTIALKRWRLLGIFILVPAVCAVVFPALEDRFASVTHPRDDLAIRERWQRLTGAAQLGLDHPILGVGYGRGRLKESLPVYLEGTILEGAPVLHTHNVYVELFAETGAIGLMAFLWLIGQALARLWRSSLARAGAVRLLGVGLAGAWIAAVVAGIGDVPFYHHETRIYFFTLIALAHLYCADPGIEPASPGD
ncbi:MAG: O-antigen ligase family protein [Chloroflexota bacterium]